MYRSIGPFGACFLIALIVLAPWQGSARHDEVVGEARLAKKAVNKFLPEERDALHAALHADLGSLENLSNLEKTRLLLKHLAKIAKLGESHYDAAKQRFRAWVIYRDMRDSNIGHYCPGQADLFLGVLDVYGVPARRVIGESIVPSHPDFAKYKSSQDYGSHSSVEVQIDGRWILADPTYYVLPQYEGKHVGLKEALEILCANRSAHFEFETLSDRATIEKCFPGRPNEYFRDMMFARVIVYKPFHQYPYDDVYCFRLRTEHVAHDVYLSDYPTCGITLENLTPANVPWTALYRD